MADPKSVSEKSIMPGRPIFEVDGRERSGLRGELLHLEVRQTELGMTSLEARFTNWDASPGGGEPDFVHFDGGFLDFGAELVVKAGAEDNRAAIFDGEMTAFEGVFPQRMPPELIVRAEDRRQRMRMNSRTKVHRNRRDGRIASKAAEASGVQAEVRADGSKQRAHWQINRSDLATFRERARAADAVAEADGDKLVLAGKEKPTRPDTEFTWFDDLLEFRVGADLAHQRQEVRVHGYSVDEKRGVHGTAGAREVREESHGGRTGPEILADMDVDAVDHVHAEGPSTDEEAKALARTLQMERARRFVQGQGVTPGTPGLRVGDVVEVGGVGQWFSGVYQVAEVRHTFDRSEGFRTHFVVQRVDVGGES